ncbi:MAG TPA: hypothetical protein VGB70_10150 [Allosphingosinicella sp.]|jgi:hypothetical protein
MAREPQYPSDGQVGSGSTGGKKNEAATGSAAAVSAQARAHAEAAGGKRNKQLVKGAAIGIGSAAIVAALLYANRRNKGGHGSNG